MTSICDGQKKPDIFSQCNGMLISNYMEKYIDSGKMALCQIYGPVKFIRATRTVKHHYLQLGKQDSSLISKGLRYQMFRDMTLTRQSLDNRRLSLHSTLAVQAYRHNRQSKREFRPVHIRDVRMI